jgi:trans-aconitate methyltransferase
VTPYLQRRRIAVARAHTKRRVIDVGCHIGPLADSVSADRYVGLDIDGTLLAEARRTHRLHRFVGAHEIKPEEQCDTLVSLAVIEQVPGPQEWLERWVRHVAPDGRVVVATPHARWDPLHGVAANVRLTSSQAHDEHESVLDRDSLERPVGAVGLKLVNYRRFLAGMDRVLVTER